MHPTRAPNLLINRLYLNLRAINHQSDTVTPEHNGMPEMAFAQDRFLGNIGAPLDPDWWNAQFDDDEGDGDELAIQDGSITPTGNNGVTTLVPVVSSIEELSPPQKTANVDYRFMREKATATSRWCSSKESPKRLW